jgi:hypothetical protein
MVTMFDPLGVPSGINVARALAAVQCAALRFCFPGLNDLSVSVLILLTRHSLMAICALLSTCVGGIM